MHDGIYETGMDVLSKGRRSFRRGPDGKMIMEQAPDNELIAENVTSRIPAMQEVISSPAVSGALQSLLGEGFALHPERPLSHMFVDDWVAVYARQRSPRFGRTEAQGHDRGDFITIVETLRCWKSSIQVCQE